MGVTPEKAIKLAVNEKMREYFEKEDGSISLRHEMIAGATAGLCQVAASNPVEIGLHMCYQLKREPYELMMLM